MNTKLEENNIITSKSELEEFFNFGIKSATNIGIELEKLPVNNINYNAVSFYGKNGISDFLAKYKTTDKFNFIKENNIVIGLKNKTKIISLEPGSQFELSLIPQNNVHKIKNEIELHNLKTAKLAEQMGFSWIGYGIQPISTYENITIIPKKRYEFMSEYLPQMAKLPLVMMRETAGVQVSFDFNSEHDAIKKLSLALKLSPIVSAIYSNSPIRDGKDTGYKSFRASSWLSTDNKRCGLVSEKLFAKNIEFNFSDYINILLDVPMIFILKNNTYIPVNGITFRQYMNKGFHGYKATKNDWQNHMSLYFPDVRLKNYIEIRNHDSQKHELLPSIPALWKGILYDNDSIESINNLLNIFQYEDFEEIRRLGPKLGINFEIKGKKINELALEILNISKRGLRKFNLDEDVYLKPLENLIKNKSTPADIIIKKWHGEWNKNISELINYSKLY